jgi:hypothetical protein
MEDKKKWYSNGLTAEEAKDLVKQYAKIENPQYGMTDGNELALGFSLTCEDGSEALCDLYDHRDIKMLLTETNVSKVKDLENKIIEAHQDRNIIRGLSVNKNLI